MPMLNNGSLGCLKDEYGMHYNATALAIDITMYTLYACYNPLRVHQFLVLIAYYVQQSFFKRGLLTLVG